MASTRQREEAVAMSEFPSAASAVHRLRIVVLWVETDIWCDPCNALCATAISYVVEEPDAVPPGLHLLTYCHACEMRDVP
ncbi:hypothetical protein [Amycolatopsis pigmentata]|uniref:Uncharacterized protein n=1 Tax=Amycolatopsis pigmentata TaxID=450801 RepID=A0ABW5FLR0_9PSEU